MVRFTLPQRTTDGLPIRETSVRGTLCRGGEGAECVVIPALKDVALRVTANAGAEQRAVTWMDRLPDVDIPGEPRLIEYRVQLSNEEGRTAGWSEPAYTVAGPAPATVEALHAEETRAGILLRWDARGDASSSGDVILRREVVRGAGKKDEEPVWLESHADSGADQTLDTTAAEDTPYRYVAVRRRVEEIGARKVDVRSMESAPVEITWTNRFPPAAPTGLSAAPFAESGQFAVDLVWEPVLSTSGEPGPKGYVVTRQAVDASGAPAGELQRLGMVTLPAFHDATANPSARYRYTVQAVSAKGVEGGIATVVVEPQ